MIHPLIRALKALLPSAEFELTQSRDWCSSTFAGQVMTISCSTPGEGDLIQLPDHEFALRKMIVADIVVDPLCPVGDRWHTSIKVLVLEE